MKILVNASKNYVLLIVKAKDVDKSEAFSGCDPKLKYELSEVVDNYGNMF